VTERKARILFVDDDPNILGMLKRVLHKHGDSLEADYRESVDGALTAIEGRDYDVIVTDVRMPNKDGFVLLRTLRDSDKTRRLPVIVLTGDYDRTLKRRALDLEATDLLNKPIGSEDLLARIRSALRLKSYQDQLANQVATLDEMVRERTAQLEHAHREVVWRLAKAGEYRDDQTGNHLIRVACYSWAIARAIGKDAEFLELIFLASPLHDIGKIGIPDRILLKPGKLTAEERMSMQQHTTMGVGILSSIPKAAEISFWELVQGPWEIGDASPISPGNRGSVPEIPLLRMATAIAHYHHERWDGSGYPEGWGGAAIPIEARIVAVADAYDAITTRRPYKEPLPESHALQVLCQDAGSHFDPDVASAFLEATDNVRAMRARCGEAFSASQGEGP
jgi:putative two-component system response regulator